MSDPKTSPSDSPDELVEAILKDGLEDYFKDADTANVLINMICDETDIPKYLVKPVFRIITPWVLKKGKAVGKTLLGSVPSSSHKMLLKTKYYKSVCESIQKLKGRIDQEAEKKQALEKILAGERPVRDYRDIEGFSDELKTSLETLCNQEDLQEEMRTGFDEVLTRLNPQPSLDPKITELTKTNWLVFSSLKVPFIGRKEELKTLQTFLEFDNNFSWWMLTGFGGTGKSRLALELCLRNATGWRSGFLTNTSKFNWEEWLPNQPTLMIVDYAAGRMKWVRETIETLRLNNLAHKYEFPVRLLVLERVLDEQLEKDLFSTGSTRAAVEEVRYQEDWLAVPGFTSDDLWDLMCGVLETPYPDKKETLDQLTTIDKEGRPLFAALAADAINAYRNIRSWDQKCLLRDVLKREEEKWWDPAGIDILDKNLLALATLNGGVSLEDKRLQILKEYLPDIEDYPQIKCQLLSKSRKDGFISALEPDIIGELYLLDYLNPTNQKGKKRLKAFIETSWDLSPIQMFSILNLMSQDFIDHPALPDFISLPGNSSISRVIWGSLCVNLTNAYGNANELEKAGNLFKELTALATRHPEEAELRLPQAQAAYNLTNAYGNANELEKARKIGIETYDDLFSQVFKNWCIQQLGEDQTKALLDGIKVLIGDSPK